MKCFNFKSFLPQNLPLYGTAAFPKKKKPCKINDIKIFKELIFEIRVKSTKQQNLLSLNFSHYMVYVN